MNIAGMCLGIVAITLMILGLIPCFGGLNWIVIPLAIIGLVLSGVGLASSPQGQKGSAVAGLVLCIISLTIGIFRLFLGGGIL